MVHCTGKVNEMMLKKCFRQAGFVVAIIGLCSCGNMGADTGGTPIPTPGEISDIPFDDGSKPMVGADTTIMDKPEPTTKDTVKAEPTALPVRGWEMWEGDGYEKRDVLVCDNDMITVKILGWNPSNNAMLLGCQNKTDKDIYFQPFDEVSVQGFTVDTGRVVDFYTSDYLKKLHSVDGVWNDYYLYNYFGVPPMEYIHFQPSVYLDDLRTIGMQEVGDIKFTYEYGYYTEEERQCGEFTFNPDGGDTGEFIPEGSSVVYEDENFRLLCVGKSIAHTEYTDTPYRVVYFIAETLTDAGECYDYAFECYKVADGENYYPSDSDYATRPFPEDSPKVGKKELQTVQAWKLDEECEALGLSIMIKVHPAGESFNYTSMPFDVNYDLGLDGFEDGKVTPVILKVK